MVESIRLLIVGTGERSPKIFRTWEPLREVCSRLNQEFEEKVIEAYGPYWVELSDKMQADDMAKYEQFKAKTYEEIGLAAFLAIPNVEQLTNVLKDADAGLLEWLLRHRAWYGSDCTQQQIGCFSYSLVLRESECYISGHVRAPHMQFRCAAFLSFPNHC